MLVKSWLQGVPLPTAKSAMALLLNNLSTFHLSSCSSLCYHHPPLYPPTVRPFAPSSSLPTLRFCISTLTHLQFPSHSDHHQSRFDSSEEIEFQEEFDTINGEANDDDYDDYDEEEEKEEETIAIGSSRLKTGTRGNSLNLSVKEKKELASYAHSLGKKLKCQQVGKSGVTASVAASFVETLEANELLKLKVHGSCPGELADVVRQLEVETGSVAVGLIGRSVILYRPSLSKMKAAEKKKQVPQRKSFISKPIEELKNRRVQKLSGRGRRGSSRFS